MTQISQIFRGSRDRPAFERDRGRQPELSMVSPELVSPEFNSEVLIWRKKNV
jgi:hypothetical protein